MENNDSSKYNLCHGVAGNLDILWEYYLRTQDEKVKSHVFLKASSMISNILNDQYQTDQASRVNIPGLMIGETGIVYFLLRLLHPEIMPNLLTLS